MYLVCVHVCYLFGDRALLDRIGWFQICIAEDGFKLKVLLPYPPMVGLQWAQYTALVTGFEACLPLYKLSENAPDV